MSIKSFLKSLWTKGKLSFWRWTTFFPGNQSNIINQPRFISVTSCFWISQAGAALVFAAYNTYSYLRKYEKIQFYGQEIFHYANPPFRSPRDSFYEKELLNFKLGSSLTIFLIIPYRFLAFFVFGPCGSCSGQNKKAAGREKRRRRQEGLQE